MSTPVPLLQFTEEFEQLLALFYIENPRRILEIGVKNGGTLYHWIKSSSPGAVVVAVDEAKQVNAYYHAKQWADEADVELHFIVGDSHDPDIVRQVNALGPFDFVFIDGDHTYDGVNQDWENYGDSPIVAFHDIVPHYEEANTGAALLWQQIKKITTEPTYEFVKDWNQQECGIGVVMHRPAGTL